MFRGLGCRGLGFRVLEFRGFGFTVWGGFGFTVLCKGLDSEFDMYRAVGLRRQVWQRFWTSFSIGF